MFWGNSLFGGIAKACKIVYPDQIKFFEGATQRGNIKMRTEGGEQGIEVSHGSSTYPGLRIMPTSLKFNIDGNNYYAVKMDASGILPWVDGRISLGSSAFKFINAYAANGYFTSVDAWIQNAMQSPYYRTLYSCFDATKSGEGYGEDKSAGATGGATFANTNGGTVALASSADGELICIKSIVASDIIKETLIVGKVQAVTLKDDGATKYGYADIGIYNGLSAGCTVYACIQLDQGTLNYLVRTDSGRGVGSSSKTDTSTAFQAGDILILHVVNTTTVKYAIYTSAGVLRTSGTVTLTGNQTFVTTAAYIGARLFTVGTDAQNFTLNCLHHRTAY